MMRPGRSLLLATLFLVYAAPVSAQTVIDEWSSVKAPPAPELKPVTVDPKTTELLVMDFVKQTCNDEKRPRCVASIPRVEKLRAEARAKGATVVSTTVPPVPITDTVPELAPNSNEPVVVAWNEPVVVAWNEPVVVAWIDKFMLGDKDTGLEDMLKDKGISTIIAVGSAAHGAILYTSTAGALRGLNTMREWTRACQVEDLEKHKNDCAITRQQLYRATGVITKNGARSGLVSFRQRNR
jgi:nicotinamidase-related amidase